MDKKHKMTETDRILDKIRILQTIDANVGYDELVQWEKVMVKRIPYRVVFEKRCEHAQCEAEKVPTDGVD